MPHADMPEGIHDTLVEQDLIGGNQFLDQFFRRRRG